MTSSYIDAVVVDNTETAKSCMQMLSEQRKSPMVFLPLSDIVYDDLDDRFRAIGGSARLMMDVVS